MRSPYNKSGYRKSHHFVEYRRGYTYLSYYQMPQDLTMAEFTGRDLPEKVDDRCPWQVAKGGGYTPPAV